MHLTGVEEMTLPDGEPIPFVGWVDWQYLTDDEIKEIVGSYGDGIGGYTRELFDKIEAKIREKNERKPKENN